MSDAGSQDPPNEVPPIEDNAESANDSQADSGQGKSNAGPPPTPVEVVISGELKIRTESEHTEVEDKSSKRTNILLAIFTAMLVVVGILQYKTLEKTDQTLEKTDQTLNKTLVVAQRAYVHAQPGNIFNLSSGNKLEARIVVDNAGQTYGKDVRRWADMVIREPLTLDKIEALGRGDPEEGTLIVAPRTPHNFMRRLDPPGDDVAQQIIAGKKHLYVFGRIEYVDMFANPRFTNFCFVYYGEYNEWVNHGGAGYASTQARFCQGHNDAN